MNMAKMSVHRLGPLKLTFFYVFNDLRLVCLVFVKVKPVLKEFPDCAKNLFHYVDLTSVSFLATLPIVSPCTIILKTTTIYVVERMMLRYSPLGREEQGPPKSHHAIRPR